MPPWPAAKGFGDFRNDYSLPQEEINRLAEWAEGGAPEGEPQYLLRPLPVPLFRAAPRPPGREIRLRGQLGGAFTVLALWGEGKAGKIWAECTDGRAIPLVWLTGGGRPQWLVLREAVTLPAGARIRGGSVTAVVR